ncbi:heterokaryon incompatibility protein-domain-containing protein [Paraphoma chrysanthemicola]|uniref:Heterokaryon incompatibility protein-domain-containing protein n=1 Tax=Paraphoma chrysanthemicola TaxID=798071 RepID=A0A8K0VU02_9PLEO|nr:heterokaryon incompatibility protein-domain-containing protein [Paraphoma chrysanthemicola]
MRCLIRRPTAHCKRLVASEFDVFRDIYHLIYSAQVMIEAYPGKLSLGGDEIRLLRLLQGAWKDVIQCELVYDTLQNPRPYHALSYVWGSSKKTKTILLDAHPCAVTVNLESTLRHLRSEVEDTLLWADALCINQDDDLERTHQVNLMGSIYRSSKGVLVYLGDGIGRRGHCQNSKLDSIAPQKAAFFDTVQDLQHIQRLMQPNLFHASATFKDGKGDKRMRNTVDVFSFIRTLSWVDHLADIPWLASDNDDAEFREALLQLFENLRRLMHAPFTPWWGRIWVVQEVVLPPQVTVVCGTVSAPWTMFARAASQCLHHLHHCCSKKIEHLPRDFLNVLQDFGERVVDIGNLRKTYLEETTQIKRTGSDTAILESRELSLEQRSLASLLRRFRGRKASDPRDKVYGLLGLVAPNSHRPPLIPDYSLSSVEVYTLAALESIYSSASLSVLSIDVARKYRKDLPTWVPDWEAPGDFSNNTRVDALGIYDACIEYPINPDTVKARYRALDIEGLLVDIVQLSGDVMLSDSSETFLRTLEEWISLLRSVGAFDMTAKLEDKMLWRVLCADVMFLHPHHTDSDDVFRRMDHDDELMFVTWALLSKRSPFYRNIDPWNYISAKAKEWMRLILFKMSILEGTTEDIGQNFFSLLRLEAVRKKIIDKAIRIERPDQGQRGSNNEDCTGSVNYAVLDLQKIEALVLQEHMEKMGAEGHILDATQMKLDQRAISAESQRRRLRAWKEAPWTQVLELVRQELFQRLGSTSKVVQIPYDIQVSLIDRSIVSATKARRFFMTKGGHIGLGPADLREGDALYLLKGARTPSILRSSQRMNLFCNDVMCHRNIKSRSERSLPYVKQRCLMCSRDIEPRPEQLSHFTEQSCSNCVMHGRRCIYENETLCYEVIGDCYAYGFMDFESVNKYVSDTKNHSWMRIDLI